MLAPSSPALIGGALLRGPLLAGLITCAGTVAASDRQRVEQKTDVKVSGEHDAPGL